MGNIIICDDDNHITVMIEHEVKNIFERHGIAMKTVCCTEPNEVLEYCRKSVCDFVLLDIDMPKMSGFELAERLYQLPADRMPIILFMSSWEQFVFEAFRYKPFDFLRKSCIKQELEEKIGRLIREYDYRNERVELVRNEHACICLKDVCYFQSYRNCIDAYTEDGCYRCKDTISAMEKKYVNCLVRTERRYLVNMNYIHRIGMSYITLLDGRKVPLSRRRREYVEEKYEIFRRK